MRMLSAEVANIVSPAAAVYRGGRLVGTNFRRFECCQAVYPCQDRIGLIRNNFLKRGCSKSCGKYDFARRGGLPWRASRRDELPTICMLSRSRAQIKVLAIDPQRFLFFEPAPPPLPPQGASGIMLPNPRSSRVTAPSRSPTQSCWVSMHPEILPLGSQRLQRSLSPVISTARAILMRSGARRCNCHCSFDSAARKQRRQR